MNGFQSKPTGTSFSTYLLPLCKTCLPPIFFFSQFSFLFVFKAQLSIQPNSSFLSMLPSQHITVTYSSPSTSFILLNQPFSTQLHREKALQSSQGNIKSVSEWICLPFWNQNTKGVILCTNLFTILTFVFFKKIKWPVILSNFSGEEEILLQQSCPLNSRLL